MPLVARCCHHEVPPVSTILLAGFTSFSTVWVHVYLGHPRGSSRCRWYLYLVCAVWTGPFWICTTLVFTIAVAGNLANYFHGAGEHYKWKYDFHKGLQLCLLCLLSVLLCVFRLWKQTTLLQCCNNNTIPQNLYGALYKPSSAHGAWQLKIEKKH